VEAFLLYFSVGLALAQSYCELWTKNVIAGVCVMGDQLEAHVVVEGRSDLISYVSIGSLKS